MLGLIQILLLFENAINSSVYRSQNSFLPCKNHMFYQGLNSSILDFLVSYERGLTMSKENNQSTVDSFRADSIALKTTKVMDRKW